MTIEESLEWADNVMHCADDDEDVEALCTLAAEVRTLRAQLAEAQKRAEAAEKEFADHKQAFHPDWGQVEAEKSSIREHMAITKAAVERAEAAEAKLARAEKVVEAAANQDRKSIALKATLIEYAKVR